MTRTELRQALKAAVLRGDPEEIRKAQAALAEFQARAAKLDEERGPSLRAVRQENIPGCARWHRRGVR
jgi:hypothetical protein